MTRLWLLPLCLVAAVSCAKKKSDPAPAEPAAAPEAPVAQDPARKPQVRRVLTPVTVEEVAALIPKVTSATVIKEPAKAQVGERVEASWCLNEDLDKAGETMKTALETVGWTGVMVRQNPKLTDRKNLGARKDLYILTGAVQKGAFENCSGEKGQSLATINLHKQSPRPAGQAMPNIGAQRPAPMRPLGGTERPVVRPPTPVQPNTP